MESGLGRDDLRYSVVRPSRLSSEQQSPPTPEKQKKHTVDAKQSWNHRTLSWRMPTIMIGSLILAVGFAIGHHLFYRYCNGQEANQQLPQQWVTRGGTAFAFVTKMFLAISTGIAYVQQSWLSLQTRPQSVRRVDAIFAILGNALEFADLGLWLRNPLLTIPAIITWLLPIAAIVTPGTITVNSTQELPEYAGLVPQLEYNYKQYVSLENAVNYVGPSNLLARLAISSAMQGEILPIAAPQPNASYSMDFVGPALSCRPEDSKLLSNFTYQGTETGDPISYISWVPYSMYNATMTTPPGFGVISDTMTLDVESTDSAQIFVLALLSDNAEYTFLACSLMNASYSVSFDFKYPSQTIKVTSIQHLNGVPATNSISIYNDDFMAGSAPASYQAIMDAFGRIMVGSSVSSHYGGVISFTTLFPATALGDLTSKFNMITPNNFGPALEELFQNMTLSLLSSTQFRANEFIKKNATQASPVNIVSEAYHNLYVYNSLDLWIAYGISIFCAAMCVTIGMLALFRTGYAYSNDFSTIFRTTRGRDFDILVTPAETKGGCPLPKSIARQPILFDSGGSNTNADGASISGFVLLDQTSWPLLSK